MTDDPPRTPTTEALRVAIARNIGKSGWVRPVNGDHDRAWLRMLSEADGFMEDADFAAAILDIEAEARAPLVAEAHPGKNHEFRTVCQRCGESGYLHVALITDLEVVKVEPRAALTPKEPDRQYERRDPVADRYEASIAEMQADDLKPTPPEPDR